MSLENDFSLVVCKAIEEKLEHFKIGLFPLAGLRRIFSVSVEKTQGRTLQRAFEIYVPHLDLPLIIKNYNIFC